MSDSITTIEINQGEIICYGKESMYDAKGHCRSCDTFNPNANDDFWFCPNCGEYTVNLPEEKYE